MSLASPLALLALALLPLGAAAHVLAHRRRRRYALRFPAADVVAAILPSTAAWRRWLPAALLATAAGALVFALARPQVTVAVPIERASVVLVTDASRSMLATDVEPSRLLAAQRAAERFLDRVPDRLQVGLVGFSTAPHTVLEPTTRREQVRAALLALAADGGTATGDALAVALERLAEQRGADGRRAPAAIVLLSDGKATDGEDPVAVARRAGAARVPVYTVALGTPDGELETTAPDGTVKREPVPPDTLTLQEIARETGGRYYTAADGERLTEIYRGLGTRLSSRREKQEVTAAFAGGGLVLLLAGMTAAMVRGGRLP
jgi:Ca-activated chloride channel family protein